ncbi:probable E3 ubiquitin-protein ligase BAH1-like 1 [Macadamia integrifolia]|uniref:probable E3 ubiquitin-protein ligase BAH1-like 1 n=1 Tax=Macadamia integrifolia TaxID=60698 RepID=UPI001C500E9D|nr:probable E3 ubiquitin-protein ligase BAH1-like 1 [Macadamia integrifolia]
MKFGETFTEYLHGEQERFLVKCSHVEYKRLKQVLKSCKSCRALQDSSSNEESHVDGSDAVAPLCQCESCSLCDQMFFSELMKESSEISGFLSSRVRRLLHLDLSKGLQKYVLRLSHCFGNDQHAMDQEVRMLINYVIMNALAIRKILKKYDKVHSSKNGRNFKTKLQAEHIELLQSPWLIELGAFYINSNGSVGGDSIENSHQFSFDFSSAQPVLTLVLPNSMKIEYNLICAICLDIVFNPYALSCGHLFCKACACSAASVLIFEGLKSAPPKSKCPICREVGVYRNSVHMMELDLLLKNRCKEYWKERLHEERAEMVKQSKEYWESQSKLFMGFGN